MNERTNQNRNRNTCQSLSPPPPAPSCLLARLPFLLDQLRALERQFFCLDSCSPTGLAAAQTKLVLLRYQIGVPVEDSQLRRARVILKEALEVGP